MLTETISEGYRPFQKFRPGRVRGLGAVSASAFPPGPPAQPDQPLPGLFGDRTVRLRADVEEEVAVLADPVHEVVDEVLRRLEARPPDIAPRPLVVHRGIRDPLVVRHLPLLTELEVVDPDAGRQGVFLVAAPHLPPLRR